MENKSNKYTLVISNKKILLDAIALILISQEIYTDFMLYFFLLMKHLFMLSTLSNLPILSLVLVGIRIKTLELLGSQVYLF